MRHLPPRHARPLATLLLAALLLAACQTTPPPPSGPGRIAGDLGTGASVGTAIAPRVEAGAASAAGGSGAPGASDLGAALDPLGDLVGAVLPGEVIVRFRDGALATAARRDPAALATLRVDGVALHAVRDLATSDARLYRAPGQDAAATLALARRLAARPDVLYAQPNVWLEPLQTLPDDPLFPRQWHYDAIRLPEAWARTTGSAEVVVAVVDTGILHRAGDAAATHPDLVGRVLAGYDFVTDPVVAGDGDGRDPDPYDVGDEPGGPSSYHGSHVAGTIGARTDDAYGVAGVDWAARLLPVRALGIGGGSLVDIVEGTLWAAGFAVPGVPTNAHPAHVVNLSLGGAAPCGAFEQEAFDRIAASAPRRAVVVVAAGNSGAPVAGFTPASCRNVLTVGATDANGSRAGYSNFGPRVDVMAPGGDLNATQGGFPAGVLSLARDDRSGAFGHAWAQGTSMAAPHVAGTVALMKALDPDLTFEEARALLVLTARPLTPSACGRAAASDCGAGLVDAAAALAALDAATPPTPGGGAVAFAPDPVDFGDDRVEVPLTLTNVGDGPVDWSVFVYDELASNPGPVPERAVYVAAGFPTGGTLAAGASVATRIGIERSLLTADGGYQIFLVFLVDGVEQGLTVRFRSGAVAGPRPAGPTEVVAFASVGGVWVDAGGQAAGTFLPGFDFPIAAGSYRVVAWTDQNRNGRVDAGDFLGAHPAWVAVAAGVRTTGVDVLLEPVLDVGAALAAAAPGLAPEGVRAALEAAGAARP